MTEAGYEAAAIERAQDLVRKKNLRRDPDVQALEDALCLVFLETQLGEFRTRPAGRAHGRDTAEDVGQDVGRSPRAGDRPGFSA